MDTVSFLSLVLPDEGYRCVVTPNPRGVGMTQLFFPDNETAAAAIQKLDSRGATVYFGCASYTEIGSRKGDNVEAAQSFWVDIDCGANKPYASVREGVTALRDFCVDAELPMPSIVASGNGAHAYWTLENPIQPEQWRSAAAGLKALTQALGFHVDPSRTSDITSILRPTGSHHRKGDPKPVKLLRQANRIKNQDIIDVLLKHLPESHNTRPTSNLNDDLIGGQEYPPAYSDRIANGCQALRTFRDTKGNIEQPLWYALLGLLAFCEDGEEKAHEWSSGHPTYSKRETDGKLKQALGYKPSTCQRVQQADPNVCKGCRHAGVLHSPIALGFETKEVAVEVAVTSEQAETLTLPDGYRWAPYRQGDAPSLQFSMEDADGNIVWSQFCQTLFYPVSRIRTHEGMQMEIEMHVKDDQRRRFTIGCGTIAKGGSDLAFELGKHEIVANGGAKMKSMIDLYLQRWLDRNRQQAEEIATYDHFGWHEDGFLIGNTLITPTEEKQVLLSGDAKIRQGALDCKGSLEVWCDVIDRAYNHPGQEGLQYLVVTAFASVLFSLFKQYGGVTVYAHSECSGVGKTTAQRAGLSAFGDWQQLQMSDKQVTTNALWNTVGTYSNLPIMFDELTNQPNWLASELIYLMSAGQGKARAGRDGKLLPSSHKWSTIMMASGNTLMSEKVATHRANSEAELMRLFEFTLTRNSPLSVTQAGSLFPLLADNFGHSGQIFIKYVVRNRDRIVKTLAAVQQIFDKEAGITQEERYWSALHTSQIVALKLCHNLGLLKFPMEPFKRWIIEQLDANRVQKAEVANTPLEIFGRLLADHWQGVLVTAGEGDLRRNVYADVLQHPKGTMHGRAILPLDPNERQVLMLNTSTVREWCNKRNTSMKELHSAIVAAGFCDPKKEKYLLGRGTGVYGAVSSQVYCWVIDLRKMSESLDRSVVQKLVLIGGSDSNAIAGNSSNP